MASTTTPPSARRAASSRRASQPLTAVLPTRLPVPMTAERGRRLQPGERLRPHLGVRGHVGRALGERGAHEQEPLAVAHHGLVREVDEDLGARRAQRGAHALEHLVRGRGSRLHGLEPRHPDLGRQGGQRRSRPAARPAPRSAAAQLLAAAGEDAGLHGVGAAEPRDRGRDHGWIVFAVDEHDGARRANAYRLSS